MLIITIQIQAQQQEVKSDYTLQGYTPVGNGFVLSFLKFKANFKDVYEGASYYNYKGVISLDNYSIVGYKYKGEVHYFPIDDVTFTKKKVEFVNAKIELSNGKTKTIGLKYWGGKGTNTGVFYGERTERKTTNLNSFRIAKVTVVSVALIKEKADIEDVLSRKEKLKKKKSKSIDDFLNEKESSIEQKGKPKTTDLDDFLNEKGNSTKQKKKSKKTSLDDFLNEKNTDNTKSDDFLDDNNTNDIVTDNIKKPSKFSYKIDKKDNLQGVISSKGKILIPYKKWTIKEYREGIAKVAVLVAERKDDCSNTYKAYKTGFVDKSTQFIDGYSIDFESIGAYKWRGGAVLKLNTAVDKTGWTSEDYTAHERRVEANKRREKRKKEDEKRRKRLQEAKCEKTIATWKQQVLNQYKN